MTNTNKQSECIFFYNSIWSMQLKGQSHVIFYFKFFWIIFPQALENIIRINLIFSEICRDIRKSTKCTFMNSPRYIFEHSNCLHQRSVQNYYKKSL
jgi:hypothetical protein